MSATRVPRRARPHPPIRAALTAVVTAAALLAAPTASAPALMAAPTATAPTLLAAPKAPKRTVTYLITLDLTGRTVVGPFASTQTVTADIVARPIGTGVDPTAWEGRGDLAFGPIESTGLPQGCKLTTTPPTGSLHVAVTGSGAAVTVNWSPNTTPVTASLLTCPGLPPAPFTGGASVQPFLMLEPKEFSVAAAGGTQQLKGVLSTGKGMSENVGTMAVTRRIECGEKVKQVNTYPPGQPTPATKMVGRGFAPGESVHSGDLRGLEFVFEDGSVLRGPKSTFSETVNCSSTQDTSKSYRGTLLLGLVWSKITSAFGGPYIYESRGERFCACVRGTTFWIVPHKRTITVTVAKGKVEVFRVNARFKSAGPHKTVAQGRTAIIVRGGPITVRRARAADKFPALG